MSASDLREDVVGVVLGILLMGVGISTALLFRIRRRKDLALLWFGLFALMYGVRLLALTSVVPFIAEPVLVEIWSYVEACLTYAIVIPALLYIREIFPEWRPVVRWLLWVQVIFVALGILMDQARHQPMSLRPINNALVLALGAALTVALLKRGWRSENTRAPLVGFAIFAVTAVVANLGSLGVLALRFNPEPIGFAVLLGGIGSLVAKRVMKNEERLVALDKELEIARRIQVSILPREMPAIGGITIAARYLPMTAVAGDFYDFLAVDDKRVGILIADVSGHGVPAALIASMVKVAIAMQLPHADDPGRVLSGMNQTLCGKLKGQFVTAAYLFLDSENRLMRYGMAGHPPLLWRHGIDRRVEELGHKGLALGLRARSEYSYGERPIAPGDRFLLYTDGVFEGRNGQGDFYGAERVRESLEAGGSANADQFATSLVEGLAAWTGRLQEDDITLVVVDVAA